MKKIFTIVGTFCVLLLVAFSIGAAPEDIPSEITGLKKEVSCLRERVKALEERLANATIIVSEPQPWTDGSNIRQLESLRQRRCIPKGWQKKEFNGHLYYVIPLDQDVNLPRYSEK